MSASSDHPHQKLFEAKHPYAIGYKVHSSGHTRDAAIAEGKRLRSEGSHASVWHHEGPRTGKKSKYFVCVGKPDQHKDMEKSEMSENMLYITIDGDGIGSKVGRAVLSDDEQSLIEISKTINAAQNFMAHAIEQMGGQVIELGGDEITGKIPQESLDAVESMRADVQRSFGFTITVGIGQKLSEASKSLLVGKTNGKDQTVIYGPEVDQQLQEVSDRLASGQGTEEDEKISEAYLEPKEEQMQGADHDHDEEGCEYCNEAEAREQGEQEEAPQAPENAVEEEIDHEHEEGEPCEYCDAMDQDANSQAEEEGQIPQGDINEESDYENPDQEAQIDMPPSAPTNDAEAEADAGNEQPIDEHTEEGMKQIAQAIEDEDADGETGGSQLDDIGAEDMPVGDHMDAGTSRPEDFDDADSGDHTMGLSEDEADDDQGVDLGSVLKDGLDSHAENIKKEKVSQMVGEALQGFKANKKVLEMAKEQAPEFYQASIAMLRAMIEMAKMLGFSNDEEIPTAEAQEEGPDDGVSGVPAAPAPAEQGSPDPKQ